MLETFWQITGLALVDAVNPCTLTVQALLLSALVITKGRKHALIGGLLFTFTIYGMYFLYGIGILEVIYSFGMDKLLWNALRILLIVLIGIEFYAYFSYKPGLTSLEMPMKFRPVARKLLKGVENPLMALPIAMLCSVLLLPCSSGPYVFALGMLALHNIKDLLLLAYYNLIFVSPMILITFLVAFGTSPEKVVKWKEKHIRELHLVAGILLLGVFIATWFSSPTTAITSEGKNTVYLIYSPFCPHCHHMMEYLHEIAEKYEIKVVETMNTTYVLYLKEKFNFTWDGGVPLLFAVLKNDTLIAIEGYPSVSQDVDGYFLGKEREQEICRYSGGESIYENGDYKFCKLPNGVILGNKYAINYLFAICKNESCKEIG